MANYDEIISNPLYTNITNHFIYAGTSLIGRKRPLTLGELLYHYKNNEFLDTKCCGKVFIYSFAGSALTGSNQYHGFCPSCKKKIVDSRSSLFDLIQQWTHYKSDIPYIKSPYTISKLIEELFQKN